MRLEVRFRDLPLGLLNDSTGRLLFQYDDSFLRAGLEPSPFYLPLQTGVVELRAPFEGGLPGLFTDSLPDYWGRTIMDRRLREAGIDPAGVSVLNLISAMLCLNAKAGCAGRNMRCFKRQGAPGSVFRPPGCSKERTVVPIC